MSVKTGVTTIYVCNIGLFSYLCYVHFFFKFRIGQYIVDFVNKTSRDKGGDCVNEKRKRCNGIPSERTLCQNDPSVGYILNAYLCILPHWNL